MEFTQSSLAIIEILNESKLCVILNIYVKYSLADLRRAQGTRVLTRASNSFQFHAVLGKIWQNHVLVPPEGVAPSPKGNPGSTTELITTTLISWTSA